MIHHDHDSRYVHPIFDLCISAISYWYAWAMLGTLLANNSVHLLIITIWTLALFLLLSHLSFIHYYYRPMLPLTQISTPFIPAGSKLVWTNIFLNPLLVSLATLSSFLTVFLHTIITPNFSPVLAHVHLTGSVQIKFLHLTPRIRWN